MIINFIELFKLNYSDYNYMLYLHVQYFSNTYPMSDIYPNCNLLFFEINAKLLPSTSKLNTIMTDIEIKKFFNTNFIINDDNHKIIVKSPYELVINNISFDFCQNRNMIISLLNIFNDITHNKETIIKISI